MPEKNKPKLVHRRKAPIRVVVTFEERLWKDFKIHCIEYDKKSGIVLEQLIRGYLDKHKKKK